MPAKRCPAILTCFCKASRGAWWKHHTESGYSAADKVYIFPDPYTGSNIQIQPVLRGFIRHLYFSLPSGSTGAAIVLITGIGLFYPLSPACLCIVMPSVKCFISGKPWNGITGPTRRRTLAIMAALYWDHLFHPCPHPGILSISGFLVLIPEKIYYQEERAANIKKRFA